jgi:hypothetical protein
MPTDAWHAESAAVLERHVRTLRARADSARDDRSEYGIRREVILGDPALPVGRPRAEQRECFPVP